MKILGRHLIVEYTGCNRNILDDARLIEEHMNKAAQAAGATIIQSVFHQFSPQGVSGVVVIAESHISIHTWPEYGYAAVDFFTCGESVDPRKAQEYMKEKLQAEVYSNELKRGIPSIQDEMLSHK